MKEQEIPLGMLTEMLTAEDILVERRIALAEEQIAVREEVIEILKEWKTNKEASCKTS